MRAIDSAPLGGGMTGEPSPGNPARLPGDPGLWYFIVADMCMFAIFFLVFTVGRVAAPELYEASRQQLLPLFGLANTLILLTSSLFMVRAVDAAREHDRAGARRNLMLAMGIASFFALFKIVEYTLKVKGGVTLTTNEFFTYYFVFTGIHFIHFVVGMGALAVTLFKLGHEQMDAKLVVWTESVGCYWHLVDLLWIVLFPMLYLLRAA